MKSLNNLLKVLLENEVDFVLVGGFAGVVHGASQVTKDIDICCLLTPEQIERLRSSLKNFNPRHRMNPSQKLSFLDHPKSTDGLNNLYLETSLGTLDVINHITGVGDFNRIKETAVTVNLFGHPCKVISLEDLIKAKESMSRDKDRSILKELRALINKLKK